MSSEKHSDDEDSPSEQSGEVREEDPRTTMEEDKVDVNEPAERSDDHSVMNSGLTETLEENGPGVEAVCASVIQQKENRQKRAGVFEERLQRLKTRMSVLDTSRLGSLGADGTLLDENPLYEKGSRSEFVTPRSIEGDHDALESPKIEEENVKHSDLDISNAKLVENVTAEVEMLNSMKSKPMKKQKVSLKVGLHAKTKLAKGKPKFNKLSSKKK